MNWTCPIDFEELLHVLRCILEEFGLDRVCLLLPLHWQDEDWTALSLLKTSFEREDDLVIMVFDDAGSTILERGFRVVSQPYS
jgi:hypothetical protein